MLLGKRTFQFRLPIRFYPQFPKAIPNLRADYWRVTEHYACASEETLWLAWLSRIPIAAISRRINGNYFIIPCILRLRLEHNGNCVNNSLIDTTWKVAYLIEVRLFIVPIAFIIDWNWNFWKNYFSVVQSYKSKIREEFSITFRSPRSYSILFEHTFLDFPIGLEGVYKAFWKNE